MKNLMEPLIHVLRLAVLLNAWSLTYLILYVDKVPGIRYSTDISICDRVLCGMARRPLGAARMKFSDVERSSQIISPYLRVS